MRILFLLFSFLSFNFLSTAQNFDWAIQYGDTNNDGCYGIKVDSDGNIYTTGYFGGTVDFDPGTGTTFLTATGEENVFVQKLDSTKALVWAISLPCNEKARSQGLAIDDAGNIYISGYFNGVIDLDPGSGTAIKNSKGESDVFAIKLDNSGAFIWGYNFGGSGKDNGRNIVVNSAQEVYTTGWFYDTVDFDPGVNYEDRISKGVSDLYVLKIKSNGEFGWVNIISGKKDVFPLNIGIDPDENIYTTGAFYDTVDFNPGTGVDIKISLNLRDAFVQKIDADGAYLWTSTFGGLSHARGWALGFDNTGNVYAGGEFADTADFDPGSGVFNLISNGASDVYILKLNSSGNLVWARGFGSSKSDYAFAIDVDAYENVYTGGRFQDTADFDPGLDTFILENNGADAFIQKLNSVGDFEWAVKLSGDGLTNLASLQLDSVGNIFSCGHFLLSTDFDTSSDTLLLTSKGGFDFFIHKMKTDIPVGISEFSFTKVLVYPNPSTGSYMVELPEGQTQAQLRVLDTSGKLIYQRELNQTITQIEMGDLPSGMYLINILLNNGQTVFGKLLLTGN